MPACPQTQIIARGATDEQLLDALREHPELFLLTRDRDFRYRASVRERLVAAKVGAFVITAAKNRTGEELVSLIVAAWPHLERFARKQPRPFVARVLAAGKVQAWR